VKVQAPIGVPLLVTLYPLVIPVDVANRTLLIIRLAFASRVVLATVIRVPPFAESSKSPFESETIPTDPLKDSPAVVRFLSS
jgi:hypothetical protein